MRTNSTWLASLKEAVLYGTNPAEILGEEKRINALAATDIQEAANRYFNLESYVQVVQYPEN